MRNKRILRLLAALFALSLVAAACGDDDTSDGADSSDSSETSGETGNFEFTPLDVGGPITKAALQDGDIDIALLFTSDADIATNEWVLLVDDKGLVQIENLIPVIRSEVNSDAISSVLDAVSSPLTTAELTELNRQVTQDLLDASEVAGTWLEGQGIIPWEGDSIDASLVVGSTNFFEQEIVAEMYSQALESAGVSIERKFQLGAREVVAPALESGEIDLYPEYIGSYGTFQGAESIPSDPATAVTELQALVADKGVTVLTAAPAEDRDGMVVTTETAEKYGLVNTSDLASVPDVLKFGGPPECPEREFCILGLQEVYGLTFDG